MIMRFGAPFWNPGYYGYYGYGFPYAYYYDPWYYGYYWW